MSNVVISKKRAFLSPRSQIPSDPGAPVEYKDGPGLGIVKKKHTLTSKELLMGIPVHGWSRSLRLGPLNPCSTIPRVMHNGMADERIDGSSESPSSHPLQNLLARGQVHLLKVVLLEVTIESDDRCS